MSKVSGILIAVASTAVGVAVGMYVYNKVLNK